MRTPYPCGCRSHTHTTVQDRDRCARGDIPCSETHPWPPLPAGGGIYVRQTCPHCGLTRLVTRRQQESDDGFSQSDLGLGDL
jgi:hypothetical protein